MKKIGKLIIFEGIDGTGKTTVINDLSDRLKRFGFRVLATREPGSFDDLRSSFRDNVRELIMKSNDVSSDALLFLFLADRIEHYKSIKSKLETNDFILCDRGPDSTLVYQSMSDFANTTFSHSEILYLNNLATGNIKSDITILLDADPIFLKNRIDSKNENNHFDLASINKKQSARHSYLKLAKENENYKIIDATLHAHIVSDNCFNLLKEFFRG